jgi:hypothetical protein
MMKTKRLGWRGRSWKCKPDRLGPEYDAGVD